MRHFRRELALVENNGGRIRPYLGLKRERVGLQRQLLAVRACNVELVAAADGDAGDEDFPVTVAAHAHGVRTVVPVVEVADHADALRIRCEHHKSYAAHAFHRHRMRTELVVQILVAAFAEQIKVEIAQHRRKAVGVVQLHDVVAVIGAQAIGADILWQFAFEQAGIVKP